MVGKNPLPSSANNGKSSNPIKIVKRDAHSVRIKLAVGGLPEIILTAFQSVLDEHLNEDTALNKCNAAVRHGGKLMEDIEITMAQGNQVGSTTVNDPQDQEKELQQYIKQLQNGEAARACLLSHLKDALQEQESRQDVVRTHLQVARGQIEQTVSMRGRLMSAPVTGPSDSTTMHAAEVMRVLEQNFPSVQINSSSAQPHLTQPIMSFAPLKTAEEENKKAAAAAVAAKLAASTSSAQMLTSILSSLVAEEAASMNGTLASTGVTSGLPIYNPEKRIKLEKPISVSDVSSSEIGSSSFFPASQQPSTANVPLAPTPNLQPMSQAAFPPAPPPAPHSPANLPSNQYVQSSSLMAGGIPYGYGSNNLPPPPPMPPHVAIGSQAQQAQQQSATGGFYRPPGIGFYGQSHPSTPPPVPRQ